MSQKVLTQIDADGNATVVLNRPEVHNAFDPDMVAGLHRAFRALDADRKVRAVVVTGAGASFSAGADIAYMRRSGAATRAQNLADARGIARMLHALHTLRKPTIACVRGAVRGGGVGLVAACDIALAERSATFRLTEVRLGILPATISPYVIAAIGARQSRRYMLSAEEFDAAEACRIGLVHEVCEPAGLGARVGHMLGQLHLGGPEALMATKRLIREVAGAPLTAALLEKTARRIADQRATPEGRDGLTAFLEKRAAPWSGHQPAPSGRARKGRR